MKIINKNITGKWKGMRSEHPDLGLLSATFLMFIVLVVLMSVLSGRFLTPRNISNIISHSAVYIIMGVGMTLVLTSGGIDISLGSIVGVVTAFVGAALIQYGLPVWIGLLVGLATGLVLGMVNGFFISVLKVPPIITTLGMGTTFRGIAYVYLGGTTHYNFPKSFIWIARGKILGVPVPVIIALLVLAWGHYFLTRTKTGRYITAIGGNEETARLAGVNTKRVRFLVYAITGVLAGLASIIITARLDASSAGTGQGMEIHTIAAVVLGGTALFGGRGLMIGTLLGAVMLSILDNGLLLAGISFFWQRVLIGLIFVLVVAMRTYREK